MRDYQTTGIALASFCVLTSTLVKLVEKDILSYGEAEQIIHDSHSGLENLGRSLGTDTVDFARRLLETNLSAMALARRDESMRN